jgi:hypothetical protein
MLGDPAENARRVYQAAANFRTNLSRLSPAGCDEMPARRWIWSRGDGGQQVGAVHQPDLALSSRYAMSNLPSPLMAPAVLTRQAGPGWPQASPLLMLIDLLAEERAC